MRKSLLFLIVVIITFATMPFVFGLFAKYKIEQLVAKAELPQGVFVDVTSYDLGYFSSHALITVKMYDPTEAMQPAEMPKKSFEFNTHANIKHGPFFKTQHNGFAAGFADLHAYTKLRDIVITDEIALKGLEDFVGENDILSVYATIGLNRSVTGYAKSTTLNYQSDELTLNWPGLDGHLYVSGDMNTLDAALDVSPFLLNAKDDVTVDFSRISFSSNATREKNMPWVGQETLSIPAFFIRDAQNNEVRFSNLIITAMSQIKHNLAEVKVEARADNIILFEQEITDTQMSLIFDRLDAKSLIEFSKITKKSQAQLTPKQKQALTFTLINMLSPGALFEFQHEIKLPEGDINAKILIKFPDLSKEKDSEPPETIAQQLIMQLNAMLNFYVPSAWLEQTLYNIALTKLPPNLPSKTDPATGETITPQQSLRKDIQDQLKSLSKAGVLMDDEDHYTFQLDYQRGNIILNGNTLTQEDIDNLMSLFSNE